MMDKKKLFAELKIQVDAILSTSNEKEWKLKSICTLLEDRIEYYDWVGFYMVEGAKEELVLGPFVGDPTEHVIIPFGTGICGQAAEVAQTVVIQDVRKVTNYLACAPNVLSEIVIPIFDKGGQIAGELDIDSHELSPFTYEDREFLEYICKRLPKHLDPD